MPEEELTHVRYILYQTPQKERKVDFWVAKGQPIHDTYAKAHNIAPKDFCAAGYMGVKDGKWLIYEHYAVADDGKNLEEADKAMVMDAFQNFSDRDNAELKIKAAETYRQEKHLFLYAIKRAFTRQKA